MNDERKLLGLLGLAARARKLVFGTDRVCETARAFSYLGVVLIASDASDNTVKRIKNCCKYYGIECRSLQCGMDDLSHAVGKGNNVSAVGVTDENFASAVIKLF